ncbi:septal ring lytic transglycosylase RlpA family protein [Variovorax sp.]|uniref:septal ring lytic transglycosylase RlpA family protein n=1 Tax=Variovorax sp. TaxID=1871043 RepID=UPI0025FE3050|nr:septal ring lytic transglycosylase RlpA family protein [Variovorax sp.]
MAVAVVLAGCASGPRSGGAGRDGPGASPPSNLERVPDAEPRIEPVRGSGGTSKPYTVLGRGYTPITDDRPFRESGLASWYGRKFHAGSTASGEPYDMYAMTAAHKTLPLPSYVRVRNPANGREAIVRVNDRGPFVDGRVIDLSYTAALKLDLLRGVAPVEIERITNEDIRTGAWRRGSDTMLAAAPVYTAPAPAAPVYVPPPPPPPPPPMPVRAAAAPVAVPSAWVSTVGTNAPEASTMPVAPSTMAGPAPGADDEVEPPPGPRPPMVVNALPPLAPAAASLAGPDTPSAGFWVQLGAFRERGGAETLRAQAARGLPALAPQLRVFSEAGEAVSQVRESLRISPMVVERR